MSNVFTDSFSGSATVVDLSTHTGETGHGWLVHPGFSGGAMRVSPPGEVTCPAFSDTAYIINQDLPAGDLDFKVSILYNPSGAFRDGGIIFRASTTAKTCYLIHSSLNTTYLSRYLNGTETVLAAGDFARTSNTYYTMSVRVRGTRITILMNGTQVVDFDDTSTAGANLPSPGRFGLYGPAGNKFDDLQIDTAAAAATSADGLVAGTSSAVATGVTIKNASMLSTNGASAAGTGTAVITANGAAGSSSTVGAVGITIIESMFAILGQATGDALTQVGYTGFGNAAGSATAVAESVLFETVVAVGSASGTTDTRVTTKSFSLGSMSSRGASDAFAISRDVLPGETFGRSLNNAATVSGVGSSVVTSIGFSRGLAEVTSIHAQGFLTGVGLAQGFSFATTDPPEPVVHAAVGASVSKATLHIVALTNLMAALGRASGNSFAGAPRRVIIAGAALSGGGSSSEIITAKIAQADAASISISTLTAISGSFIHKPPPVTQTMVLAAVPRSLSLPAAGPRIITLAARASRTITLASQARTITL
jgi:hypothetical protein